MSEITTVLPQRPMTPISDDSPKATYAFMFQNWPEVTPIFFHRPSVTSTYDSDESIATLPPESDLDDEQMRKMLASPLYLQASVSLLQRKLSHKRKSSQESRCDRDGIPLAHRAVQGEYEVLSRLSETRLILGEQRDHLLAEARSEVLQQECRADFLDCSIRELQRKIHFSRTKIDHTNLGYETSRREQARLHEYWRSESTPRNSY